MQFGDAHRQIVMVRLAWVFCVVALSGNAAAEVRLPAIIGSGMVLQQESEVPLWGWATPGERIRVQVEWSPDTVSTSADGDGAWRLRVRTPKAGGPYRITITGDNALQLDDVLIGEVWICGGQSNMEWSVGPGVGPGVESHADVIRAANQPEIRLFNVQNTVAVAPATDCAGRWQRCTPQTLPPFSAVGYFFGRNLHERLHVPIGLISSNWGGTPAESWTSETALRATPELAGHFADGLALVAKERTSPGQAQAAQEEALARWWRQIESVDARAQTEGWMNPAYDDSGWKLMDLPAPWRGALEQFDGVVWFRRAVDVPADWAGRELVLELGPIDDVDDTFVNGQRVGGLHGQHDWATPRKYVVPAGVGQSGRNVIAVRVLDTGGGGGLAGKPEHLRLHPGQPGETGISLAGPWRHRAGPVLPELPPRPPTIAIGPHTPSTLYNGMIAPLVPFAIRGVIWYQGESNRSAARLYGTLFPALIADWRGSWGQGDFSFYYVQIAPFGYAGDQGETAQVREAQRRTLTTPNTGMAVTLDIGNPGDIHPGHKDEVGRRLALWALAKTYSEPNLAYSGPLYNSMVIEGARVRLRFDHVGSGLVSRGGQPLTHFTMAGADRVFYPASAVIDGDDVVVSSEWVDRPVAVRYAAGTADEPNLANREGLPAAAFCTDDWPSGGAPGPHLAIDATRIGEPISPYIYGQFIEHLGRCIYGGIWAEMIEDRKFFHPVGHAESPWSVVGPSEAATMVKEGAFVGEHSPQITLPGSGQPAGIVQRGLAVKAGQEYMGRIWLAGATAATPVQISLIWGDGPEERQSLQVDRLTADFARTALSFRPTRTAEARLEITATGRGALRIGTLSLMPADNVSGLRADTLALLRELDAPVYRWPGGNFVSGYDWRDGIGDRDRRPPRKNPAWQGVEHNDFGLDEFMTFCRILGTEPYIALNTGLSTIENAVAEMEYANGAPDTTGGTLRARHGHAEPYRVQFWGIGNEMYGDWQLGHIPLAEYTRRHNAYVDALRKVDPSIQVIGVGAVGEWSATMLRDCADRLEYLSEHVYWHAQPDLLAHVRQAPDSLQRTADAHRRYRREFPSLKGRDIRICEDEWNYWYGPHVFGELGTRYFLKDALGCAAALHQFARNSDLFFMANYAQTVNVIGAIKTSKTAAAFETTGLVLKLYRRHFGHFPVATHATPDIDAQAAWSADRRVLTIGVVNPSLEPLEIPLALHGVQLSGGGRLWQIAGDDPLAFNDPDDGIKVRIEERAVEGVPGALEVAPCSVTLFALPAKAANGLGGHSDSTREGPAPLVLAAPIDRWDEALPLGNGCMGGLLWGRDNRINLSLDRGDLWDLRTPEVYQREDWNYATLKRLQDAGDQTTISKLFDEPYDSIPYPTKIPAGRLEIELDPGTQARTFTLDLQHATGHVETGDGGVECFYSATEPVALLRIKGRPAAVRLVPPTALQRLGYVAAVEGCDEAAQWFVQDGVEGLRFAVVVGNRTTDDATELALAITSTRDGPDPLGIGRQRVAEALSKGYETLFANHRAWWRRFWSTSVVRVPDEVIQTHYDLVKYFYGAASRSGAPPMPLQGVWTAADGGLPPWKGDFHNDLNTQMTYLAYHTAGLTESGESFLDFNWSLRPAYQRFAREFFDTPGLIVPGVMALDGQPLGGWSQYALSPTMGAWVAHSFYLHWRYTMDEAFLRERAYPWCAEVGEALLALLKPDERGKLMLPLSSSPEIFDNSLRAWLPPNSNFDLALLRWLFGALAEMAEAAGHTDAVQRWQAALARLDELDVESAAGPLTFAHGLPYHESHRHFSHTMAIHPLGTLNIDGTDRDRAVIQASLDRILEKGTDAWCGYSFSWMACLLARCGRAEEALDYLKTYQRAFILRNGFHANGDQTGSGLSRFTYRPFTLEGNFLALQAVHEMLLRSWGGVIRVFPAVSEKWKDVSFVDLRAEGAFRVSAQRKSGRTVKVSVAADRGGKVRLRDPFGGESVDWNRPDVKKCGTDYEVTLERGAVLTGTRAAEALPRPTPEQAAWQDLELIAFAHFGINTFTDREWGDGAEDPKDFNPTHFDARQWVAALKPAGVKLLILTAKHHDGFCLWPSQYTEHSVKNSRWRDGRGDVVREVAQACREGGLKFGLYLSPWDRHETTYGESPAYNEYFKSQLRELLRDYGEIAEVWFDGACGEGPNGKKQEYDWAGFYQVIRELQPHALIAIMGPDIRWVGNEDGLAREDETSVQPAVPVNHGGRTGPCWYPAECDVSIRPGWFYHAKEDEQVKGLAQLMDIYCRSVGRNSVLLLNVPPDRRGLIHEHDARRLAEFGAEIQRRFGRSVAETQGCGDVVELALTQATTIDHVILMEDITGGERVQDFVVEGLAQARWETLCRGQVIGHKRIARFPPAAATRVRLRLLKSLAEPMIRKFAVYAVGTTAQPAGAQTESGNVLGAGTIAGPREHSPVQMCSAFSSGAALDPTDRRTGLGARISTWVRHIMPRWAARTATHSSRIMAFDSVYYSARLHTWIP